MRQRVVHEHVRALRGRAERPHGARGQRVPVVLGGEKVGHDCAADETARERGVEKNIIRQDKIRMVLNKNINQDKRRKNTENAATPLFLSPIYPLSLSSSFLNHSHQHITHLPPSLHIPAGPLDRRTAPFSMSSASPGGIGSANIVRRLR